MTLFNEPVDSIVATIGAIYVTLTDLSIKRPVMSNTRVDESTRLYLMT